MIGDHKKFLGMALVVSGVLVILYYCLAFAMYRKVNEDSWIWKSTLRKESIAESKTGQRMLFAGGSATLFGVRTKMIERDLGAQAVNLAVHAGLQTDYILYRLKNIGRKGDVVILPFEYELFNYDGRISLVKLSVTKEYDTAFWHSLPVASKIEGIVRIGPVDFAKSAIFRLIPSGMRRNWRGFYSVSTLNENGDETRNSGSDKIRRMARGLKPFRVPTQEFIDTEGLKSIKELGQWCRSHGITLYVSYPNVLYFKEYETAKYRRYFEKLQEYFATNGIAQIGAPQDFFFDLDLFYDSPYHLNSTGVEERTRQLMDKLREIGIRKGSSERGARDFNMTTSVKEGDRE